MQSAHMFARVERNKIEHCQSTAGARRGGARFPRKHAEGTTVAEMSSEGRASMLHFVVDGGANVIFNAGTNADDDNAAAAACSTRTRHCGSAPDNAAPLESFL
jgi:hypothetical protein